MQKSRRVHANPLLHGCFTTVERAIRRLGALWGRAAEANQRMGRWVMGQIVQDVPSEIANCEFRCYRADCKTGEWKDCNRRRQMRAEEELAPEQVNSSCAGLLDAAALLPAETETLSRG